MGRIGLSLRAKPFTQRRWTNLFTDPIPRTSATQIAKSKVNMVSVGLVYIQQHLLTLRHICVPGHTLVSISVIDAKGKLQMIHWRIVIRWRIAHSARAPNPWTPNTGCHSSTWINAITRILKVMMSSINSMQEVDWVNFECECNTPLIQLMNSPAVRYVAEEVDVEVRKYERPINQTSFVHRNTISET